MPFGLKILSQGLWLLIPFGPLKTFCNNASGSLERTIEDLMILRTRNQVPDTQGFSKQESMMVNYIELDTS